MKISGYTLHGDYYLADEVIPNKTWKEALKMKNVITLPNGKKVTAHILSKEELETIPIKERKCGKWYWTSTPYDDNYAWYVNSDGDVNGNSGVTGSNDFGGVRLGFHKNETKQLLNIE
jgi:hypothetical protein